MRAAHRIFNIFISVFLFPFLPTQLLVHRSFIFALHSIPLHSDSLSAWCEWWWWWWRERARGGIIKKRMWEYCEMEMSIVDLHLVPIFRMKSSRMFSHFSLQNINSIHRRAGAITMLARVEMLLFPPWIHLIGTQHNKRAYSGEWSAILVEIGIIC